MTDDPFHDWRSRPTATGIRRDPDIAPGVKAPERRVLVVPINLVKKKGKRGNIISYREFYPVALSLDIAMNAAEQARAAFNAIEYHEYQTARGTDRSVKHESHDSLLSFLEHAMVAVTFSFQALETFANEVIGDKLEGRKTFEVGSRSGPKVLTAAGLQRFYTTEEKIADALPKILNVKPLEKRGKAARLWDDFMKLKNLRDEIAHLKWESQRHDRQSRGDIDDSSLWHTFLNADISQQPKTAALVLFHFAQAVEPEPPWLPHIVETFGIEDSRPKVPKTPDTTTISVSKALRTS